MRLRGKHLRIRGSGVLCHINPPDSMLDKGTGSRALTRIKVIEAAQAIDGGVIGKISLIPLVLTSRNLLAETIPATTVMETPPM